MLACFLSGMGKELAPWCVQTNKLALFSSFACGWLRGCLDSWICKTVVTVVVACWLQNDIRASSNDDELEKDDIPIERGCEKLCIP